MLLMCTTDGMHITQGAAPSRVKASDLKKQLDAGRQVVLLDVRTSEEFEEWRMPNAVNLPLSRLLEGEQPQVPRDAEVVTVCLHGPRSEKARQALAEAGYRVASLEGGMVAWNSVYDVAEVPATGMTVRQLRRVGKGCVGYILANGGDAIAIDPTLDKQAYLDVAAELGTRIVNVLDTHAHADHASGARKLAAAAGARYLAPEEVGPADGHVHHGDEIRFGGSSLRTVATPGHTPGSVTYVAGDLAFTGDTLFVESVGRPDLGQDPRPNARVLWRSLHDVVLPLPSETRVLPGHFGDTVKLTPGKPVTATIGELRTKLSSLTMGEDEFVEWIAKNSLPKPSNFEVLKNFNRARADVDLEELRDLEAGPNRCSVA